MESINLIDQQNITKIESDAFDLIQKSTAKASAIAAVPIPLVDIGGVTFIQLEMVKKLAEAYNVDTENQQKLLLSTVLTTLIGTLISEAISSITASTQLEKILSESLIKATIAGLVTTITGEVYQKHFAGGGNLDTINLDSFISYIQSQLTSDRISAESLGSQVVDSVLSKFGL